MERRSILGLFGGSALGALSGCCLPPVSRHTDEQTNTDFANNLRADGFLARVEVDDHQYSSLLSTPLDGESLSLARVAASRRVTAALGQRLPPGYQLLEISGGGHVAQSIIGGKHVVWLVGASQDALLIEQQTNGTSVWDRAHAERSRVKSHFDNFRISGMSTTEAFIEPNLEMRVVYDRSWSCSLFSSSGQAASIRNTPNKKWPADTTLEVAWHKSDSRTGLSAASASVWNAQKRIRIGHLDTGYDPRHVTLPANIDGEHERNFLDPKWPKGPGTAVDPGKPKGHFIACSNTHGTGTLSLLAGNAVQVSSDGFKWDGPLGAAPNASIIPMRIADSVIHLYSITMGAAIYYAANSVENGGAGCDVISLSAGGLPTQFWADAVNHAYEEGVTIVAATGDCIHGFPTRSTVWPARFRRTIAAAGVTEKNEPYDREHSSDKGGIFMEGSYGPEHVMSHALSSYAPNTPWAAWEELAANAAAGTRHTQIDMDGGGTSAATPQIAGATALYLAQNPSMPRGWKRVEATRKALFSTARPPAKGITRNEVGHGILDARAALAVTPNFDGLAQEPRDVICNSFLEALLNIQLCDSGANQMLAVEMAQLIASDPGYEAVYPNWDAPLAAHPLQQRDTFIKKLVSDPRASQILKAALTNSATSQGISLA
jgi:hypothetical protein